MAGPYTTELDAIRNAMMGDLSTDGINSTAFTRTSTGTLKNSNDVVTLDCSGLTSAIIYVDSGQNTAPASGAIDIYGSVNGTDFASFPAFDISDSSAFGLQGEPQIQITTSNWFRAPASLTNYVACLAIDVASLKALRLNVASTLPSTATATLLGKTTTNVIQAIASVVFCAQSGTWNMNPTGLVLAQGSTTSGQTGPLIQTATTTSAPVYTTGKTNPVSTNTSGEIRAVLSTTSSLAANQSVNVAQINGVTPLMGAGNTGTGSPRVTIATDQAILTNAWKSNVAQINGVAPLMGDGISGTGSLRVNPATDASINTNTYSTRADTYTTTTSGTTVDIHLKPMKYFSVAVKATGAVTSWSVVLEGSLDNTNFSTILTHTNSAPGDGLILSVTAPFPVLYFRSRCSAITLGGGTNVVTTILGMQ